jgi:hypothetical protein
MPSLSLKSADPVFGKMKVLRIDNGAGSRESSIRRRQSEIYKVIVR